jgi:hypothetical protein
MKDACANGHPYPENAVIRRSGKQAGQIAYCKACYRERYRETYHKRKPKGLPWFNDRLLPHLWQSHHPVSTIRPRQSRLHAYNYPHTIEYTARFIERKEQREEPQGVLLPRHQERTLWDLTIDPDDHRDYGGPHLTTEECRALPDSSETEDDRLWLAALGAYPDLWRHVETEQEWLRLRTEIKAELREKGLRRLPRPAMQAVIYRFLTSVEVSL